MDKCSKSPSGASRGHLVGISYALPTHRCSILPSVHQVLLRIITLRGLRLNHDGGIPSLIILRPVGDRPNHITRVQPYRRSQDHGSGH